MLEQRLIMHGAQLAQQRSLYIYKGLYRVNMVVFKIEIHVRLFTSLPTLILYQLSSVYSSGWYSVRQNPILNLNSVSI